MSRLRGILAGWTRSSSSTQAMPIGIDFAAEQLNLLQLRAGGAGARPAIQAALSVAYPVSREMLFADTGLLRDLVQGAMRHAPFVGRKIYSAMAPAEVRIVPLTVHVAAGQNEQQAVAKAVREHIGGPLTESVVDYYHVRAAESDGPEKQVLVAVAQQARVLAYLETLRGAGLDPVALDIGPSALARLLAALQAEDYEQSVLLINFGVAKSFLTVVWGRRLMIDREIDFGEAQLTAKLARSLDLAPDMALALLREHGIGGRERGQQAPDGAEPDIGRTIREILHPELLLLSEELSRTQVYVASRTRGSSISRVYLNGSAARYPHIQTRMRELVALPVELLNPFDAFADATTAPRPGIEQGIALAAGLALRGVPRG